MAMEQPIRARVPEHVSNGAFSTGVIVMTANSEFILDFVQNLGRPHQITARVVMPHYVLPQLVDALQRNIELYRSRWGELPQAGKASPTQLPWSSSSGSPASPQQQPPSESASGVQSGGQPSFGDSQNSASGAAEATTGPSDFSQPEAGGTPPPQDMGTSQQDVGVRHPTAQDIYDDLKIRDELLSGAYANAVMIGHGAHEFSFDFITNFYPHSSVSARVFMAAGQVPRFYESLKGTWEQLKARNQSRGGNPGSPGAGGNEPSGDDPDAPPSDNPFA